VSHDDFAVEPVPGLPAALPAGESLLWQGRPAARSLAIRAFHARKVALYFLILAAWSAASALHDGQAAAAALTTAGGQLLLGAAAVGILVGIAVLVARTTIYSVTSERVVVRFGVALQFTVNLPFTAIASVSMRRHRDGTGDLPITLATGHQVNYLLLWPHVRPWRLSRAEPMLRVVSDPEVAAERLAAALQAVEERRQGGPGAQAAPAAPPTTDLALPRVAVDAAA
jgi:hypothetical protein